jgi:cyclophilin family peptidyl-prolyl cis-trans isomerase
VPKIPAAARTAAAEREAQRRRQRRIVSSAGIVVAVAVVIVGAVWVLSPPAPVCVRVGDDTIGRKRFEVPPCNTITDVQNQFFVAHIETTLGSITVNLDPVLAAKTVNNFVFLARTGFFDGQEFRVDAAADHAVVQSGDPLGNGKGGPGYTYQGETPSPITRYVRGVVAMANTGDPSSNGSQFFIVVRDYDALGTPASIPKFTFFGFVPDEASLAVLDRMIVAPRTGTKPTTPIRINTVRIEEVDRRGSPTPTPHVS